MMIRIMLFSFVLCACTTQVTPDIRDKETSSPFDSNTTFDGFTEAIVLPKEKDCPILLKINKERYYVSNTDFSKEMFPENKKLLVRYTPSRKMNQCEAAPIIVTAIKIAE